MRISLLLLVFVCGSAWTSLVSAQVGSLNRSGSGARAAGMADIFVAVSDDGTAASWNPAGLAQLTRPEGSLVGAVYARSAELKGFHSPDHLARFTERHTSFTTASPDFVSLALPFTLLGRAVTVQGGWWRQYDFAAHFKTETFREALDPHTGPPALRLIHNEKVDGGIDVWSLAGAVKLTRRMALGVSVDLWRGEWMYDVTVLEQPWPSGPGTFVSNFERNRLRGNNWTLGMLLTYPRARVGVVYHAPFSADFLARAEQRRPEGTLEADFDARAHFDASVGAGVAFHPAPRWTVSVGLAWDPWSKSTAEGFPGQTGPVNLFDSLPQHRTSTRDTLSAGVGLEYLWQRDGFIVPLRAGAALEPQGEMDVVRRDPRTIAVLALGTGLNTNSVKLDAAVQYRFSHHAASASLSVANILQGDKLRPDAYGMEHQAEWRVKVSAIFRLSEGQTLGEILQRVFVGG